MAKLVGGLIATVCVFILFLMTYFTVDQNELAVVTKFGHLEYVADPGLHFKVPFVNSTTHYRTDIQAMRPPKAENTYTIDNQEVDVVFTVFYRIPADKVAYIYTNNQDYQARLLTMATDRLKAEMGQVNVQSVAEKRGELRDRIKAIVKRDAAPLGIEITDFQLPDLQFTDSFRAAVGQAAVQKAMIETREYEMQQAKKAAETAAITAEGAANAVRAGAKGAADARVFQATAEARAIQLTGEAQAAAIKAQADALTANPKLVDLRKAERWDGALPRWMQSGNGGVVPFMNVDPGQDNKK